MPLNVLPSITNPPVASSRAPRCRFDSQPLRRPWPHSAASTTRSSVCSRLILSHDARAPARLVRRSRATSPSRLRARAQRVVVERLARPPRRPSRCAGSPAPRASARDSASKRSRAGAAVSASASHRRQSKKNTDNGSDARMRPTSSVRPNRRIVSWNGCGAPSGLQRDRFAVEDQLARAHRAQRVDDLRRRCRDVVAVAREDAHVVTCLVHLHARAVDFPLERRGAQCA